MMAEQEWAIDSCSFALDHSTSDPAAGLCPESFAFINSAVAKEALARLPAAARNVLVCADQLAPSGAGDKDEARRRETSAVEFAAIIARVSVEERRQMLNEMEELRMFHFDACTVLYHALIRRNPDKFGKKKPSAFTAPSMAPIPPPMALPRPVPAPTPAPVGPGFTGLMFPNVAARDPSLDRRRDFRR